MPDDTGAHAPRPRVAYLARVRAGLHLPDSVAVDVIEELAAHFSDATDALRAQGMSEDDAERETMARLGPPAVLADEIRRAHQTARRALAAAGGGVLSAATAGTAGFVLGFATLMIAWVVLWTIVSVVGLALDGVRLEPTPTTGTALGAWVWGVAAYLGARAATRRIALVSRRAIDDIRLPLALLFAVVVAVVLALQPVYLDTFAALAMLLIPLAAGAGAVRATESEPLRSWRTRAGILAVVIVGAVVVPVIGMFGPVMTTTVGELGRPMTLEEYREVYGPRYAPMGALAHDDLSLTVDASYGGEAHEATVDIDLGRGLDGWSDIRLEAWLRDPAADAVATGATTPIGTAPIAPAGRTRAVIDVGTVRGVGPYFAVVSGTSPEGERVILNGPVPMEAVFRGTLVEWLVAPSAR